MHIVHLFLLLSDALYLWLYLLVALPLPFVSINEPKYSFL